MNNFSTSKFFDLGLSGDDDIMLFIAAVLSNCFGCFHVKEESTSRKSDEEWNSDCAFCHDFICRYYNEINTIFHLINKKAIEIS